MALIERNREPSANELRWFGLIILALFAILGGVLYWQGFANAPYVLWVIGVVVCAGYYLVAPARRLMYLAWMAIVYPIGWVVSHAVMLIAYYGVLTPIGLIMRAVGYDPMHRRFDPEAKSYWVEHRPADNAERYFRQY